MKLKIILVLLFVCANAAYTFGQEKTTKREKPVEVGETAPDFTLEDENGKAVKLSASTNKERVVLVFYRGYW